MRPRTALLTVDSELRKTGAQKTCGNSLSNTFTEPDSFIIL